MNIQIWIDQDDLETLIKVSGDALIEVQEITHPIVYTKTQVTSDQICINVNPDLFIGLQDRFILVPAEQQMSGNI
jgi:hypothetical protein